MRRLATRLAARLAGRVSRRQRVAALLLAAVAVGFVALDLGGAGLRPAHSGVRGTLGALYRGTDAVLGPARRFVQALPHAGSADARVRALEQQNAGLRRQLADARLDRATAARLRTLQLAARRGGYRVLPARVVALSPALGFDWTVTLDVGSDSGVAVGQTVTDGEGLVGRVLHADASSSVVLLAVDRDSGVGVRDRRTGQLGVATGAGADAYSFRPLDPAGRVAVGDVLETGPAGRTSFVAGLSVGRVSAVHLAADGTTSATVTPTVSAGAVDLVGVVLSSGDRTAASRAAVAPSGALARAGTPAGGR